MNVERSGERGEITAGHALCENMEFIGGAYHAGGQVVLTTRPLEVTVLIANWDGSRLFVAGDTRDKEGRLSTAYGWVDAENFEAHAHLVEAS